MYGSALIVVHSALVAATATGTPPKPVVQIPFASSLAPTGASVRYRRGGSATYFDTRANRIVTVGAHTPRFVATAAKRWGAGAGLLLERGSANLLLDSSFEVDLAPWTFGKQVVKHAGVGVHGGHGLTVNGPATLTHRAIPLKTPPSQHDYIVSIYVRRRDTAAVQPNDVRCYLKSDAHEIGPRPPSAPERLGGVFQEGLPPAEEDRGIDAMLLTQVRHRDPMDQVAAKDGGLLLGRGRPSLLRHGQDLLCGDTLTGCEALSNPV